MIAFLGTDNGEHMCELGVPILLGRVAAFERRKLNRWWMSNRGDTPVVTWTGACPGNFVLRNTSGAPLRVTFQEHGGTVIFEHMIESGGLLRFGVSACAKVLAAWQVAGHTIIVDVDREFTQMERP